MFQIKALANTDTVTYPDEFVKAYGNNYLASQENEARFANLDSEVIVIKNQDSNKNIESNTCYISTPDIICLSQTANLLPSYAITVYKSQGSTLAYIQSDLN